MPNHPRANNPRHYRSYDEPQKFISFINQPKKSQTNANTPEAHNSAAEDDALARYTRGLYIATCVIAIAAIATFFAALLQWSALNSTDDATHRLVRVAVKQANTGISQVNAMRDQLGEMQRQSDLTISQLRPKLTISFGGPKEPMKIDGKEGWFITPIWENHGGSEGIDFWGWDASQLFAPDAPIDFDFITPNRNFGAALKTVIGINAPRAQQSRFITREDVKNLIDKRGKFVLWGYIEYRESLPGNQPHHVHWCYEAAPIDAGNSYTFAHPLYRAECNTSD
jgi:hypothetical protein